MEKNRSTLIDVVLVGRPNVGKSSLFNALLGKRRAIVDPTRGVTRDVVQEIYKGAEVTFNLSDTGGFTLDLDEMSSTVREKTISQLNKSGIVIFVIDVMEWTPEDEEFTRLLRPLADKVILVVNKVDSDKKMASFYDYASLGFSESVATSVSHYKGISKLKEILEDRVKYIESLDSTFGSRGLDDIDNQNEKSIRIAILGRPNSGKSTLINALSEEEVSLVSPVAGTTRDAIKTRFKHGKTWYEIWDTAGIRRRSKVGESVEYYSVNRAFKSLNDVDVVLLMVESLEDLSSQDKKIASQVVNKGRPIILCLSKWDLLKKEKNLLEAITDRIKFLFPLLDFAPVVPISSLKREGFEDLFKKIHQLYKQSLLKIETSRLNNALKSWTADFPPPRPYKVKYLTQVDCHPIKYIIFVNNDEAFPTSYLSYLKNRIRSLGHLHVPIHLEVRKSS